MGCSRMKVARWSPTEGKWPAGVLFSVSEAKDSPHFLWQLQLPTASGSGGLLEVGCCPRNLCESWEKQSEQKVPSNPSLVAQSSGILERGRISKGNLESIRTHCGQKHSWNFMDSHLLYFLSSPAFQKDFQRHSRL